MKKSFNTESPLVKVASGFDVWRKGRGVSLSSYLKSRPLFPHLHTYTSSCLHSAV